MNNLTNEFAAYVGIDWADQKHDICLSPTPDSTPEYDQIDSTPEALNEWLRGLHRRFSEGKIAVCLEQSRGPLMYQLMRYDFLVLYPVNPKALARYREAFNISGAKDDKPDANLLRELVCVHRNNLTPWTPDDEVSRALAMLSESRRKAVNERTKITNRLTAALKEYFPQAFKLTSTNLYDKMSLDFLEKWPTLEDVKSARDTTIRAFYTSHRSRPAKRIEERLQLIRSAIPLTTDKAILMDSVISVRMFVQQLKSLNQAISEYDQALEDMFDQHPDKDIFESFPGAGDVLKPRLAGAFGTNRAKFATASDIQEYSGIAPVTRRSGNSTIVQRRRACPTFLLQTFHEYASHSRFKSVWAKAYYELQRSRGKGHHMAIRSLAFKWLRIIHRCWRDRVAYDEAKYLQSLVKNQSPLLQFI
ncbi:IS110 family transposase [Thermodesulfobacteriota bacterium B35]